MWTRRRVMAGLGAVSFATAAGLSAGCERRAASERADRVRAPTVRPEGVPTGPFDANATAEQVTEGVDLAGKVVVITGVTSGIGQETMRVLALRGAHVIGTGRTLDKAREACAAVHGRATALMLELTDYPSVVACAEAIRALEVPVDALVCNAGVMALPELEQVEGIEKQFATNHLGHFLLTAHLIDRVKAAPQGRVVVVSSNALTWAAPAGIEWDNLSGARDYDPDRAYGQSKLANALFALQLSKNLAGTRATANALHPGYVDTNLFRNYPRTLRGYRGILSGRKMTVAQGAATSCYMATAAALAGVSGQFFRACNPIVPDPRARDAAAAARLWRVSEQLLARYL